MKNIWLICKYATSEKYSFNTRHFSLSNEWVKNGYDVTIISSNKHHLVNKSYPHYKGWHLIEKIDGIRVCWLKIINYKYAFSIKRIISWLQFEIKVFLISKNKFPKPNIIIVSSLSLFSILSGVYYSKKYNAKFILEIRDIWPLVLIEIKKYSKKNIFIIFLRSIEKFGYKKSDLVVGTMPNLREHLAQSINPTPDCITVPQGIRKNYSDYFVKLEDNYVKKHIPKNKFIFAYTGAINRNNPIDIFLDLACKLSTHHNLHFLILGNGDRKDELIKKYSHQKNISFPPYLNKRYINDFLSYSSVCIDSLIPGIGKYGISRNKWIDYMIAAKPIICYYEGYQSIINEANCGEFVKFGDEAALEKTILKFIEMKEEEISKIGKRGKKYILEHSTFDKLALKYQHYF